MIGRLQQEEEPLDKEIVAELIELTPEWWKAFILEVNYSFEQGMEKYSHVITSLEDYKEFVEPSEKLFDATYRLGFLFKEIGKQWRCAKYKVNLLADGSWKYTVDFEY